jgi:hypothetical protein
MCVFASLVVLASYADLRYIRSHGVFAHMWAVTNDGRNRSLSSSNILNILKAIEAYNFEKKVLPPRLSDLVAGGYLDARYLENPRWPACGPGYAYTRAVESYWQTPGVVANPNTIIVYEPYERWPQSGVLVGQRDGIVRLVPEEDEFRRLLAKDQPAAP